MKNILQKIVFKNKHTFQIDFFVSPPVPRLNPSEDEVFLKI